MSECFIVQSSLVQANHRGFNWIDDFTFTSLEEARRCIDRSSPRRPKRIMKASNREILHEQKR